MRKLVCALCAAALLLAVLGAVTGSARREPLEIPARGLGPLPGATEIPLQSGWVDVNGGDPAELIQLPGVGETLAALIIAERERGGHFSYPEDLLSVRGIGAKKLESIREMLDLTGGIEPD